MIFSENRKPLFGIMRHSDTSFRAGCEAGPHSISAERRRQATAAGLGTARRRRMPM